MNEFKRELKALLKKHKVALSIMMSDCSDTYGIYDEGIGFFKESDLHETQTRLCDGYSLHASDIKEAQK